MNTHKFKSKNKEYTWYMPMYNWLIKKWDLPTELYDIAAYWEEAMWMYENKYYNLSSMGLDHNDIEFLKKLFPTNNILKTNSQFIRLANNDVYKYIEKNNTDIHQLLKYIILGP